MTDNYAAPSDVVFSYGAHDGFWTGMGTALLKESGAIRDALCRAERIVKSKLGVSLPEALQGPTPEFMFAPITTVVQLALTAEWYDRGIKPTAVLGRCVGEFAAVHASGGLSFDDALNLSCRLGGLVREGKGAGKIFGVSLSENEAKDLRDACPARFEIVSEGPNDSTIIACDTGDVGIIGDFLSKHNVQHVLYPSSVAPHSWILERWKAEMLLPVQEHYTTWSIPVYSATSRGRVAPDVDWTLHFWRVVREPISIRSAIRCALDDGFRCFLEIGGQPTVREFILREAHARNLHVDAFATMERLRSLHEVMAPTHAALTAVAQRQSESLRSPSPAPAPASIRPTKIRIEKANPYQVYAQLRKMGPVLRSNWWGVPTWLVPRYRDAITVFEDSRFVRTPPSSGTPVRQSPVRAFGQDLSEPDPPEHMRVHKLIDTAFTPQMVQRLDRRATQVAAKILDGAKARGAIELMSEYASVIPITLFCELLGDSVDDLGKFRSFIYALTYQMSDRSDGALEGAKLRFTNYLQAVFAARRAAPRDDFISSLVNVDQDSDRLSPDELIGVIYTLLVTWTVTTANLIGNGTFALLRHPEQLEILRRNPALVETAVEELLRFESPLELSTSFYASTEIDLSRAQIPRGATVRVLIASTNRDEQQFCAPDTLDITRWPCPHLSFGQANHRCLGASLVRLEGRIALSALIERAPNLRLRDPLQVKWMPHPMYRGLQQLPLLF